MADQRFSGSNGKSKLLPEATRERWQPIRGGLLNIYRYDYMEFRYEAGRLLLRGNNGTGKSRVLALQLPFLLDGEIIPQRVEPDGDTAKRMDWNLLLGKYDDRLGYTWVEFGCRSADGTPEYRTLGCGLRAVAGRGIAARWFFITKQRIGRDLFLQNEAGQPLSRQKLELAVASGGRVYDKPEEYRRAVDDNLFHLGDRYAVLLNLLIQLRQPQLSRKLDEQKLSDALSQALPPLSERVLGDVAEAFRGLESDRDELSNFIAARDAAELFLRDYRRYTQIAARRRAKEVREKHAAYETTMRRLRAAETTLEKAEAELQVVAERIAQLSLDEQRATAEQQALFDSPQMKDAKDLDGARRVAHEEKIAVETARSEHSRAMQDAEKQEAQRDVQVKRAADTWQQAEQARDRADHCAATAGVQIRHREAVARLPLPEVDLQAVVAAEESLWKLADRRLKEARHVETLNKQVDSALQAHKSEKQRLDDAESQFTDAVQRQREAKAFLDHELNALFEAYFVWSLELVELRAPSASELQEAFDAWCESVEGESPLTLSVRRAESEAARRLATQRAGCDTRRKAVHEQIELLGKELQTLRTGYHEPPPPPHTRDAASRLTRAGAPLWALCDFAPETPQRHRANIEAALEAAGLLDAWLTPDGCLLDASERDTLVVVSWTAAVPEDRHLGRILVPAVDRSNSQFGMIEDGVVSTVLRQIGFGKDVGEVWIDVTGCWQIGPLHGAWSKAEAQHIGHAAREENRRRRIDELEVKAAAAREALGQVDAEMELLDRRTLAVASEAAAAPTETKVRSAIAESNAARKLAEDLRLRVTAAERRVTTCRQALTAATDARDRDAQEFGIAEWVNKLAELVEAIHIYRQSLAELFPAIRAFADAHNHAAAAEERLREAFRIRDLRSGQLNEAMAKAEVARVRFETLERSVGAGVRELQQNLQAATERISKLGADQKYAEQTKLSAFGRQQVSQNEIQKTKNDLDESESRRRRAITALIALVMTRVLRDAHSDFSSVETGEWSVTRAVDLARRIEVALSDIESDDGAWNRNQRDIHSHFETLQTALRTHGYMPEATIIDEIFVVTVPFQSRSCTMTELRDAVVAEIVERQTILDARERDVLEKHLINDVAEHLHNLLHSALKWVDEMNAEIQSRPMSTGMTLRFKWEPVADEPKTFAAARDLLLRARGTWAPAERLAVGQFLHQQIKAVRVENDTGTWQEHLELAFDYRRWHQFAVERKQEGVWRRLTKRTHGTGSGGEKAIALTLPQFAAAAAHYRTAGPSAPRLILLDEAFVGVDSDMRSKCMDLLTAFDLDFVMTSEREWACYPTVPAVAIYQLSARPGIDAVGVTRWVWNGKHRMRDDSPICEPGPPADSASTLD